MQMPSEYDQRLERHKRVIARADREHIFPADLLFGMADGIAIELYGCGVTLLSDAKQTEMLGAAELALKAMVAWCDAHDYPLSQAITKHSKVAK